MAATVHEVEFTGLVLGWIAQLIQNNGPDFPISEARIEGRALGSQKRRDLTLYDRDGSPCLTGEVKLPWAPDGHSPFFEDVVLDAREKAEKAGVQWFITWNINELLLWHREDLGALGTARTVERYQIANVQRPRDLDNPKILQALRNELERFVILFARTLRGERGVDRRPPDLYFIHSLESFLDRPIQLTRLELSERYGRQKERERLDSWMRDRQGWTLGGDEDDLLLRAAKFTNYTVANRLIFYEALRKRFSRLRPLDVPDHVDTAERLFDHLRAFFDEACHVTGDYETVFGIDPNDVGDRIPFYADAVVASWRLLTQHVHRFDFSHLEYDVIGQIFETLIGPEERHKYGQYYTRPEVVDIINSFCIRSGEDKIMDPGCGGGTFLVRAYARKRHLAPRLDHLGLLRGIFGVDVSRFATHLSTINLAVRDLVDAQNYPRVVRSDFFDLEHDRPLLRLPGPGGEEIQIRADALDAIVANPPYVRQEEIPKKDKERYRSLVKREVQLEASGRSDLHVFLGACRKLSEAGRMVRVSYLQSVAGRRVWLSSAAFFASEVPGRSNHGEQD
jgi:N-6 DNA Methylase